MNSYILPNVVHGQPDECWPWTGYCNTDGYGQLSIHGQLHYAHRVAFGLVFGPAPTALSVLHSCDNPPCCNPHHLWLGTPLDNVRDMMHKGRHRSGSIKLTRSQAAEILASSDRTVVLAERYGVSASQIRRIRSGEAWASSTDQRTP